MLNCDLPSVARRAEDPELLFRSLPARSTVVFDEVHRLANPPGVLKIGADAFRSLRLLATGSSTPAATRTFRDSLTGRNFVVSPFVDEAYDFRIGTHAVRAIGCADLMRPEWLR